MTWTVVKVGGSLYDWPMLGERLAAWLTQLDAERVLIVPGGGAAADAIRSLDRIHRLGEETSHWLAIRALSLNAQFLRAIVPNCTTIGEAVERSAAQCRIHVLDAFPFFAADENRPDHLPHHWQITSDSLAVRVAALIGATELVLLKSVDWIENDWSRTSQAGVVDSYFQEALSRAPASLRTRIVNLRTWCPAERCESPRLFP